MKTLAMIFAALAVLADALTTHRALQAGRKEGNPILRRVLGAKPQLWAAIAWRVLIFGSMVLWVPMPWWAWAIFGGVFVLVACRNATLAEVR